MEFIERLPVRHVGRGLAALGEYYSRGRRWRGPLAYNREKSGPTVLPVLSPPLGTGAWYPMALRYRYRPRDTGYGSTVDVHSAPNLGRVGRGLGRMGQVRPPAETVDLLTAVRTIYANVVNVEPLLTFLGQHPVLAFSVAMLAILAGGAIGGYIGAGWRTTR